VDVSELLCGTSAAAPVLAPLLIPATTSHRLPTSSKAPADLAALLEAVCTNDEVAGIDVTEITALLDSLRISETPVSAGLPRVQRRAWSRRRDVLDRRALGELAPALSTK
jgi:hypothetical protein